MARRAPRASSSAPSCPDPGTVVQDRHPDGRGRGRQARLHARPGLPSCGEARLPRTAARLIGFLAF